MNPSQQRRPPPGVLEGPPTTYPGWRCLAGPFPGSLKEELAHLRELPAYPDAAIASINANALPLWLPIRNAPFPHRIACCSRPTPLSRSSSVRIAWRIANHSTVLGRLPSRDILLQGDGRLPVSSGFRRALRTCAIGLRLPTTPWAHRDPLRSPACAQANSMVSTLSRSDPALATSPAAEDSLGSGAPRPW